MKVSELILALQHIDQNLEVTFVDNNGFAETEFRIVGDCLLSPDHQDVIMSNDPCVINKENYFYPRPKPIGYGVFHYSIPYEEFMKTFSRCCLINVQLGY